MNHISIDFQQLKSHSMCTSSWKNSYNSVLQCLFYVADGRVTLWKTSKSTLFLVKLDLYGYHLKICIIYDIDMHCCIHFPGSSKAENIDVFVFGVFLPESLLLEFSS